MTRSGYTDALKQILEGQPALARPQIEVLQIIQADFKNTEDDYTAGTLTGPESTVGFEVIAGGGIRLAPVAGALFDNITGFVAAGGAIDVPLDNRPVKTPGLIGFGAVLFSSGDKNKPIFTGQAAVTDPGGGTSPETVSAQLFRVNKITLDLSSDPTGERWELLPLSAVITVAALNGNAFFDFSGGAQDITAGEPPIADPPGFVGTTGILEVNKPVLIMVVWGTRTNGSPATVGVWEFSNPGVTPFPDPGGSSQDGLKLQQTYQAPDYFPDTSSSIPGLPGMSLEGATFSQQVMEWTTNPIDLGAAPGADTKLTTAVRGRIFGDSAILLELKQAGGGVYTPFVDFDVIGEDNTPTGGSDLSAVPRVQSYDIRVTLTPSSNSANSPELFTVGVSENDSDVVDDQVEVESFDMQVDPLKCDAEIPTASIRVRRDGVKDYRSFIEDTLTENAFAALSIRLWIGHPTLARSDWLEIETYRVRNWDASGDGVAIDLTGQSLGILEEFPPPGFRGTTDLYEFAATDVAGAWLEIMQLMDIPPNQIGQGPPDANAIERILTEIVPAIQLRQELDFIAGGVTISRQGAFEFRSLFDSTPPSKVIELAEYHVVGWDLGADRRTGTVQVNFPDPDTANELEKEYTAPDEVLAAYGSFGGATQSLISGSVTEWIPDVIGNDAIPDQIGNRLVDFFGTGVQQVRIKLRTPRPDIEVGDVVSIDQDRLLQFDPFSGAAIRGRSFVTARVTGVHEVMGRELTLWLQPTFQALAQIAPTGGVAAEGKKTALLTFAGGDFRPARFPEDFAAITGSGVLQKRLVGWDHFDGSLTGTSFEDGLAPQVQLPVALVEKVELRTVLVVAEMPVGTLTFEFIEHPQDGSASTVISTHVFTNSVGREFITVDLSPAHVVNVESTYSVEGVCTLLDETQSFDVYGFALKITEAPK